MTESYHHLSEFYDQHRGYVAKRDDKSPEYRQWLNEVLEWKIPNLAAQMPDDVRVDTICEVGCATGELLCLFPLSVRLEQRVGFDVSSENVRIAQQRFPQAQFASKDILNYSGDAFDLLILSDVLEHVPDDVAFLTKCSQIARYVLLNLPLEKSYVNRNRECGLDDRSGHLRAYSLEDGLQLVSDVGMQLRTRAVRWFVDQPLFRTQRRSRYFGTGATRSLARLAKFYLTGIPLLVPAFRHWYFPANLFAFLETVSA